MRLVDHILGIIVPEIVVGVCRVHELSAAALTLRNLDPMESCDGRLNAKNRINRRPSGRVNRLVKVAVVIELFGEDLVDQGGVALPWLFFITSRLGSRWRVPCRLCILDGGGHFAMASSHHLAMWIRLLPEPVPWI